MCLILWTLLVYSCWNIEAQALINPWSVGPVFIQYNMLDLLQKVMENSKMTYIFSSYSEINQTATK